MCGWEDSGSSEFEFFLTLTNDNIDILAPVDYDGNPINPKNVIFKSRDGKIIETEFVSSYVEEMKYSDTGEIIEYVDEAGNEYVAMETCIVVKRK